MKRTTWLLPFCLLSISLSACTLFNDDKWKDEYGSPELFLSQVGLLEDSHIEKIYKYEMDDGDIDPDYIVKDKILASGPFTQIKKKSSSSERYFTYQAYWQPATSGPNYCNMSIWDDGLITIHHKNSLGPHSYLYFSMSEEKAVKINDLVFSLLESPQKS